MLAPALIAGLPLLLLPQPATPPATPNAEPPVPAPAPPPAPKGLAVQTAGNPGSPAIVFIHGGYGDRRVWDASFDAFADEYFVIRYDHRGFGGSAFPVQPYAADADVIAILDSQGVERAHLVGSSMGGMLALDVALTHPARVATLTLVSSGPGGFPVPEAERESIRAVFTAASTRGPDAAIELWLAHPTVAVSSKDPVVGPRLRAMVAENSRIFAIKNWPTMRLDPPANRRLGEVAIPTLVIVGEQDTAYVRSAAAAAAEGIPGAALVTIPGADHLPQLVAPEAFNAELRGFLTAKRDSEPPSVPPSRP